MEKYSSYKDSGVKWLGEIPSHWETRTLKYCCSLKGRIGWNGLRSEEFQYSSYAYLVTGQDFIGSEIDWSKCYQISQERYDEDPYIQLNNGDMLITKDGTIGKVAKVTNLDKPACLNSGIFVIKQKGTYFNQGFLYWMLCSNVLKEFNIYTQTGATIAHLYQNVFENMPCILPPLFEQNAIASYLDTVTSKIDIAIEQQKKMIELLNERKQIIINNAVTKGLDPNVKMKDSGVDWIGEIPEGWEVRKLKHVFRKISDGTHFSPVTTSEGYPYITATDVNGKGIDYNTTKRISSKDFETLVASGCKIEKGDILLVKDGATTGRIGMKTDDVDCVSLSSVAMLTPMQKDDNNFLMYVMMSDLIRKQIDLSMAGAAMPRITLIKLSNFVCLLPNPNEQSLISNYIESKLKPIEYAIDAANLQITLLQERKQIIINEVVTGKVKVS